MRGLMIKDWYNFRPQLKSLLLILLLYVALALNVQNVGGVFTSMLMVVCAMMSLSLFSYDEYSKWDNYAMSMPVTREEIVTARYLFSGALVMAGTLLCGIQIIATSLLNPGRNLGEQVALVLIMVGVVLFMLSIMLPLCYKIGVEKARMAIIILMMVTTLVFVGSASLISESQTGDSAMGQGAQGLLWGAIAILAGLVAYWISLEVSIKIYKKRDF